MLSWLSDRSRIRDMITLTCYMLILSCLVYDFCRKVTTACDQHVNVIMSRVRLLSESYDYAVMTFRQKSHTRHDNINMLVTCCRDFPTEVVHETWYTTACDQHVNVIMSGVRFLSESHDSMWRTCWYYHVSCTTSVGKSWLSDRSRTRDMIISTCWSHAVMTFRQKSHTRHDNITMLVTCCRNFPTEVVHRQHVTNMLMLSCLVCDFCRKVMTTYDQHVNVIMCRVRLLSKSDGSMWTTCWYYHVQQKSHTTHDNINMFVTCCRDFPTEVVHETW
jgi:small nuclear ribonucleoprotein (snRNP)-like protein